MKLISLILLFTNISFAQFNFWHGSLFEKIPPRWPYGSLGDLTLEAG